MSVQMKRSTAWGLGLVLRSTRIISGWNTGTTCRSAIHPKQTWCGGCHLVLASVAERLKQSEPHRTSASHRRLHIVPTNEIFSEVDDRKQ